ncbi:MAG: aspartate aminotransferase family protein [Solirubrobacterales bacterium]|nr:aspartate aminotransferase family protein [Solirubrobacterales bacterium]
MPAHEPVLRRAAELAEAFLAELPERPVAPPADVAALRAALGRELQDGPLDPVAVIEDLARDADPGLTASAGPRFHGFVIGGSLPVAVAADWLVSAWDQCAGFYALSPAASVVEEVAGGWVLELLGLPAGASVGFVTGAQAGNVVGLAAARHAVLARAGHDVERDGLQGAPPVRVVAGEQAHATVFTALRLLGLGAGTAALVPADDAGRMRPDALAATLDAGDRDAPTIVIAQAGNVATGAFDPLEPITDLAREHGAWLHVDGAFGLWAAAAPSRRHLTAGIERADSWAVDAHKWLNVPYDCAMAIVADPGAHRAAMGLAAAYLTTVGGTTDPTNLVPESSRRARAVPVYAALRALGRDGVAELVERCCAHARRFAELLGARDDVEVLNDVVLNQVLLRFGDDDARTRAAVEAVQRDGTLWLGETTWDGRVAMRIAVSGWMTTEDDVERSARAIAAAAGV